MIVNSEINENWIIFLDSFLGFPAGFAKNHESEWVEETYTGASFQDVHKWILLCDRRYPVAEVQIQKSKLV